MVWKKFLRKRMAGLLMVSLLALTLAGCVDVKGEVEKARELLAAKKYEEALAAYDNALSNWDKRAKYDFTLEEIEAERERTALALADSHLDKALALMKEDKFDEAYAELDEAKRAASEYGRSASVEKTIETTRKGRVEKEIKGGP